jgi:hypothetical protein
MHFLDKRLRILRPDKQDVVIIKVFSGGTRTHQQTNHPRSVDAMTGPSGETSERRFVMSLSFRSSLFF